MQASFPLPAHVPDADRPALRRLLAAVKVQFTVALSFDGVDGPSVASSDDGTRQPLPELLVRLGYEMAEYSTIYGLDGGQVARARKRYGRNELDHYEVAKVASLASVYQITRSRPQRLLPNLHQARHNSMEPLPTPLALSPPVAAPAPPPPPRPPPFFGCFWMWCLLEGCIPSLPHSGSDELEPFAPLAAPPPPPPFRRRSRGASSDSRNLPSWAKPSALVLRRGLRGGGGSVGEPDGSGGGNVGVADGLRLERIDVADVVPGR